MDIYRVALIYIYIGGAYRLLQYPCAVLYIIRYKAITYILYVVIKYIDPKYICFTNCVFGRGKSRAILFCWIEQLTMINYEWVQSPAERSRGVYELSIISL